MLVVTILSSLFLNTSLFVNADDTQPRFADVPASHWSFDSIELMAAKNIATGTDANHFSPSSDVTRAQFVTFIIKALKIETGAYGGLFDDVADQVWYTAFVEKAAQLNIVSGTSQRKFQPDLRINREQMAVMLLNTYKYIAGKSASDIATGQTANFSDISDVSSWAKDSVVAAFIKGYISGMPGGKFEPKGRATRAQAAIVIIKLMNDLNWLEPTVSPVVTETSTPTPNITATEEVTPSPVPTNEPTGTPTTAPTATPVPTPTGTPRPKLLTFNVLNQGSGIEEYTVDNAQPVRLYGKNTNEWKVWSGNNIFTDKGSPGSYIEYRFEGTQVILSSEKLNCGGQAKVTVYDENGNVEVEEQIVDTYRDVISTTDNLYVSPILNKGVHSIKLVITGEVNPQNATVNDGKTPPVNPNWTINLYAIRVFGSDYKKPAKTPSPTPEATPTPTPHATAEPGKVRIATTCIKVMAGDADKNLEIISDLIDKTACIARPDVIVLSEAIYERNSGESLNASQSLTDKYPSMIAEKCIKYNVNIVVNLLLRGSDGNLRNTNVFMNRQGKPDGMYYKIHLAWGEMATAGTDANVIDTEIGKVGMNICFDLDSMFFQGDVAKQQAVKGAKIIFASTMGEYWKDAQNIGKANNVYMVVSGQDKYSYYGTGMENPAPISAVFAPDGTILAQTEDFTCDGRESAKRGSGSFCYADIDAAALK